MASSLSSSNSSNNNNRVQFVVGNTYKKVPLSTAKLDRSGTYRKIHDWTLFVDVLPGGDPDLLERVSFDLGPSFQPTTFVCNTPVPIRTTNKSNNDNTTVTWRFQTRQQTYGPVTARIVIRGCGGSILELSHEILFRTDAKTSAVQTFYERRPLRPPRALKLPQNQRFGIELELTSAVHVPPEAVAENLQSATMPFEVVTDYSAGRSTSWHWKLVPDSSIVCNTNMPNCHRFELVSPILQGGTGLQQTSTILQRLNDYSRRQPHVQLAAVNKSMGFHVHIDVSTLSHQGLIKVCQNFIKYESVLDSLMPPSRRTGSSESDQYFQSNRMSVAEESGMDVNNNKGLHEALGECQDIASLVQLMNRTGRYYKLNLQNLVSDRRYQPTVEFRQHSATMNFAKVGAWIRFCYRFCYNSATLAPPRPFAQARQSSGQQQQQRSLDYMFDALFWYVIKDRALRNFYRDRRQTLRTEQVEQQQDAAPSSIASPCCCDECAAHGGGGSCMASYGSSTTSSAAGDRRIRRKVARR